MTIPSTRSSSGRLMHAAAARPGMGAAASMARLLVSLKARRIAKGLSQQAMADRMGCARATFNRIENGANPTDTDFLFRWIAALGGQVEVRFDVTLGGEQ